jgi:hypothetical protein
MRRELRKEGGETVTGGGRFLVIAVVAVGAVVHVRAKQLKTKPQHCQRQLSTPCRSPLAIILQAAALVTPRCPRPSPAADYDSA